MSNIFFAIIQVSMLLSLSACFPAPITTVTAPESEEIDLRPTGKVGGSPASPLIIETARYYEISESYLKNYFSVYVNEGDWVYLHALMDRSITSMDHLRCMANPNYMGVTFGDDVRFCSTNIVYEIEKTGDLSFNIDFLNRSGYFRFDIVPAGNNALIEGGGNPSQPKRLKIGETIEINSDYFENYYQYIGQKGDELYFDIILANPLADIWKLRCGSNPKKSYYPGISIKIGETHERECGTRLIYTIPENGIYQFSFGYPNEDTDTYTTTSAQMNLVINEVATPIFDSIESAQLETLYASNELFIRKDSVNVTVGSGSILHNKVQISGKTVTANYGDRIVITNFSSTTPNSTSTVIVSIGGEQGVFEISTM